MIEIEVQCPCLCTHTHRSNDTVTSPLLAWLADSLLGLAWPGPGWPVLVWLVGWPAGRLTGWMAGRLPARLAGSLAWPVAWPGLVEAGLVRPGRAWAPGLAWLAAGNRGPQLPSFTQLCITQIFEETDKNCTWSMMTINYLTITIALSDGPPA